MRRRIDAFDVFNFTQRLSCYVFPSLRDMDKPCRTGDALRQIVDGELCLFDTPREIAQESLAPNRDVMEEFLQRHIGKLIRRDREIASRILADLKKRCDRR